MRRRRRLVTLGVMLLAVGAVAAFTVGTGHAYPEPPRQHIVMSKVCPPAKVAPSFLLTNVTDDQSLSSDKSTWSPETIEAFITVGDKVPADLGGPAANGYLAKVTVLPGETKLVTTSNAVAWQQVFFVHFKVMWRGQITVLSTKNMCA